MDICVENTLKYPTSYSLGYWLIFFIIFLIIILCISYYTFHIEHNARFNFKKLNFIIEFIFFIFIFTGILLVYLISILY